MYRSDSTDKEFHRVFMRLELTSSPKLASLSRKSSVAYCYGWSSPVHRNYMRSAYTRARAHANAYSYAEYRVCAHAYAYAEYKAMRYTKNAYVLYIRLRF